MMIPWMSYIQAAYIEVAARKLNVFVDTNTRPERMKPGDFYLAMRNGQVQLMVFRQVRDGMIDPEPPDLYPYNFNECVRVEEMHYFPPV